MEGVQFLLRDPVYITEYSWGFSWVGLFFAIISIVFTIASIKCNDVPKVLAYLFLAAFNIATSIPCFSTATETEVYSHAEYQVVISDDVKLKEFMELYEIVDVKGDTYTIVIKSELEGTKELA